MRATMTEPTFNERILDRLAGLGGITSRAMFGGWGVYCHETIFAILHRERLYFKVDEQSKRDYVASGMEPFRPNEHQTLKSYYELPPNVLEDPDALLSWAREAIRAGQTSR